MAEIEAAIRSDQRDVLLERVAEWNGVPREDISEDEMTPLALAAKHGRAHLVQALLDAGEDVNAVLGICVETALHYGVRHADVLKALLQSGAEIEALNDTDATPLLVACMYSTADCVATLLNAGANANAQDCCGFNPLHLTITFQSLRPMSDTLSKVECLMKAGANPNAINGGGETPLDMALRYRLPKIAKALSSSRIQGRRRVSG